MSTSNVVLVLNNPGVRPISAKSRKVFGPEKLFQKRWRCTELFILTGFAFKQSLHLCNISNRRIFSARDL